VKPERSGSPPAPRLSAVIVAHNSTNDLRRSLPALTAQLAQDDQLIIVDNRSDDDLRQELQELAPHAQLIATSTNLGFAAGANLGAAAAEGELIVLLNPDAIVQPGWAAAIREPYGRDEWAAWMALVTMERGRVINTSGGTLHFTGLGWAGQAGRPIEEGPPVPTAVGFLSGACLAIPATMWRSLGGFAERYFMYCEDVDLSLRLRLRGERIGVIPNAIAVHAYDFDKSAAKWRFLERNRWATIVRTYPTSLLALLAPALLATEVAIWAAAIRGRWVRMKALATRDFVASLPRLMGERRQIQRTRAVSVLEFAAPMRSDLSSPYLGRFARHPLIASVLRWYWRAVLRLAR
jgi:GT2 family glycosyltransferase